MKLQLIRSLSLGLAYSDEVSSRLETDRDASIARTARALKQWDDIATEAY